MGCHGLGARRADPAPFVAAAMTRQNFGAGLYAPLRVAVYEDENGTTFEYDKPSTLFAQFHDPKIDEVSHSLDDRLAAVSSAVAR
jgi:uncharacterized protein (DUF302 family)